jgi:hypothetical protein
MRLVQGPGGSTGGSTGGSGSSNPTNSGSFSWSVNISGAATIALVAGMALTEKDLLSIDDDGMAYKATDAFPFSGVAPNAGQDVVAATIVTTNSGTEGEAAAPVILTDGSFVVYSQRASSFLRFQRYNRQGALIKQVEFPYTGSLSSCRFVALSNGNMAFSGIFGTNFQHMVLDRNLAPVLPLTTIETANANGTYHRMIPLTGGGYAVVYARNTPAQARFAIYSNTGAVVLAPTSFYTMSTGVPQLQVRMAQFSGGNIILAFRFDTTGEFTRTAVYSSAGATIQAPTLYAPMNTLLSPPSALEPGGNVVCIAWMSSGTCSAGVVSNTGAVLGTTLALAGSAYVPLLGFDGTDFKMLSFALTDYVARMTTLPSTGVASSATTIDNNRSPFGVAVVSGLSIGSRYVDGEFLLCWGSMVAGGYARLTRVREDTSFTEIATLNPNRPNQGIFPPLPFMPGVALVAFSGSSDFWSFCIKRWRSAAIIGVALTSAARGADVVVAAPDGYLPTNAIVCAAPSAFNNNATTVQGQRGTIFPKGVALRGLTS